MTTIVDVTYLAHWPGKVTGIPRVISEYIARVATRDDYQFVVWETLTSRFVRVSGEGTIASHGRGIEYLRREGRAMSLARAARFGGAGRAGSVLLRTAQRRNSAALHRAGMRLMRIRQAERLEVVPGAADVFVSFMGEWHDQHYIDAVLSMDGRGVRIAWVSYDMLPIVTPQFSGHATVAMTSYLEQVLPVVDLVLSISEHSRRDLVAWAGDRGLAPRVEVFRLGDDFGAREQGRGNLPDDAARGEFILCVGTVEARKNHALLYYAYGLGLDRGINLPELVIVGREGYRGSDVLQILRSDPRLIGRIRVLTDADDAALGWLYEHCRFTVYPSFYEGWGLPIAESLARRRPVIASATSSMPEVGGDAVDYFDPFSPEEFLQRVMTLMDDGGLAAAQVRVDRYEPTLWDETARQVDELVESIRV